MLLRHSSQTPVTMEYKELLEHGIATKDFVRTEIAEVRTEIAEVRTEIAEVRTEIAGVRTEVRTGISDLRAGVKEGESRIIKWVVGTAIAGTLVFIGILNLIGLNFQ